MKTILIATILLMAVFPVSIKADQSILLDGSSAGKRFDGIGAVSGGGATSVLLKDYPQPQRSQILDLLFKPMFGASMSTLYVEVPGDGNSTQGSEPSHMHTRIDENYSRGYEWWIMREAKNRDPSLTLDACAWSCPGWVGDGQFWTPDMCEYYVKWIQGLKKNYGLELDAIGCRNERGAVEPFAKMFRRTLNANGLQNVRIHAFDGNGPSKWDWCRDLETDRELRDAVDIISNHTMSVVPTPDDVKRLAERFGKPIWNTEEHIYTDQEHTYGDDFDCALGMAHQFNDNFISSGVTKIVNWYLVGSIYGIEPYAQQPPPIIADSPWSGHYSIKPILWTYAHYGQFSAVGWQYMSSACRRLVNGGTIVALKSPAGDFSLIAETADADRKQTVAFKITGGLANHSLCVWRTNRREQFVRRPDIAPIDGAFTLTLDPQSIYSISTTTGQQKGAFAMIPRNKPFPFPYHENFDHYGEVKSWGYLPHYTADICGVFELADNPRAPGKCLRQVLTTKAQSWAPEWMPYTILGDTNWTDYEVSADVFLDDGGWAGVMGRINSTGNGWDGDPDGYYVRLYADGGCALYVADQRIKGSRDRQLVIANISHWRWNRRHNVKLRFQGSRISCLIDSAVVLAIDDKTFSKGMVGLISGGEGNGRNSAVFDDLVINEPGGQLPAPTLFPQDNQPIY